MQDGLEYHRNSMTKLKMFITTSDQPSAWPDARLTEEFTKQINANRSILLSIIRCLELAGCQGISLRKNHDNLTDESLQGNFYALIRYAIVSGDTTYLEEQPGELCKECHVHVQQCSEPASVFYGR